MTIGEKLYGLRKDLNLSQEEVANKLNVSRQTISKWETDQSTPDFDKIAPLCELYEISADDLLNLNIPESAEIKEKKNSSKENRKKALVITLSTSIYFLGIIYVIMASETFNLSDAVIASGFLGFIMLGSGILIYYFVSREHDSSEKIKEKKEPKNKICDLVISIISIITVIIYLVVSFKTMAWHITWIIWLVFVLVVEIIKLLFQVLGGKNER